MKRLLFITFLLCSFVPNMSMAQSTKTINLTFSKEDYNIIKRGEGYDIRFHSLISTYGADSLAPALPFTVVNILLDPDKDFDCFSFTVEDSLLMENIIINAKEPILPTSHKSIQTTRKASYARKSFPDNLVSYSGTHTIRGYKIASFLVSPFQYNSITKDLFLNNSITINVTQKSAQTIAKSISSTTNTLHRLVANPQDICLYSSDPNLSDFGYNYIIITCDSLKDSFQRLAFWETMKGVPTKVLTTEEIDSLYEGNTMQLKIKAAIKDYYNGQYSGLEYVLLGGDVEIVPTQLCCVKKAVYNSVGGLFYNIVDFTPTDWFSGCLDTMDWDTDQDGDVGETDDSVDIAAEVVVSRLPVKSCTDVTNMIERVIKYTWSPPMNNWEDELLMCGRMLYTMETWNGNTISDVHFHYEKEHLENGFPLWNGDVIRFFDTGTDFEGGANYDFSAANLQAELSKGYHFVNIDTHGPEIDNYLFNSYFLMEPVDTIVAEPGDTTILYELYDNLDASNIINNGSTIILTSACQVNRFDDIRGDCIGEAFMRNPNGGILSFIASSRDSWRYASLEIDKQILQGVFNGQYKGRLGKTLWDTKNAMQGLCNNYDNGYRWILFSINMLGDPEMPVYISQPGNIPHLNVTFTNNNLSIYTSDDNTQFCVMSRDDMGDSYYDISDGSVTYPNITKERTFCITQDGCLPYIGECASIVHLQNRHILGNYHILASQTLIGKNVSPNINEGSIIIEKGKTSINSPQGVIIQNDFEVKLGAELEINVNN